MGNNTCSPAKVTHGTWAWIGHGAGHTTRYAHLHTVLVKEGQRVSTRTRLGSIGRNGNGVPCKTQWVSR